MYFLSGVDTPPVPLQSTFLTDLRDTILAGKSLYGDPTSPRAVEKLAELDAKIAFGRSIGEIAPPPPAWTPQRAAQERLAQEFPVDPTTPPHPELLAFQTGQIEALKGLDVREQANRAQAVVDDVGAKTSRISSRYAFARNETGEFLSGSQVVAELLKEAAVAINQFVEPGKRADTLKLLPLSRDQLELWAVRGRNIAAYTAVKARYGL